MTNTLLLELDWQPGTLQRLLGMVERRGFEVTELELIGSGNVRQLAMVVLPSHGQRDFAVLCRQLDRLHGVCRLENGDPNRTFSFHHRFPLVG